jgi:hypothetical protein
MGTVRKFKNSQAILAVSIIFALSQPSFAKDHVSITSLLSGATVEKDEIVVGKTPDKFDVPGVTSTQRLTSLDLPGIGTRSGTRGFERQSKWLPNR